MFHVNPFWDRLLLQDCIERNKESGIVLHKPRECDKDTKNGLRLIMREIFAYIQSPPRRESCGVHVTPKITWIVEGRVSIFDLVYVRENDTLFAQDATDPNYIGVLYQASKVDVRDTSVNSRITKMLKIVTYATKTDGAMPMLQESFEKFKDANKHSLNILGLGEEWRGFGHRIHRVLQFAKNCAPDDLLLCIDAYDVVLTSHLTQLEETYDRIVEMKHIDDTRTVIISEEKLSMMEALWAHYMTFGSIKGKHLSAGVYMGRASAVITLLNKICANPTSATRNFDDQVAFNLVGNRDQTLFYFDSDWDFFATFNSRGPNIPPDQVKFNNDGTLYCYNKPIFVLHMPGNVDMSTTLGELGYDVRRYTYRSKYATSLFWHCIKSYPNVQLLTLSIICLTVLILVLFYCVIKRRVARLST